MTSFLQPVLNRQGSFLSCFVMMLFGSTVTRADIADVRVLDNNFTLELVAEQPEIVTPIGIACDSRGRLLVVESHTHKRPNDYEGPATDRIRMLEDSDDDGRLDRWSTYYDGLSQVMNLVAYGDDIYVVTTEMLLRLEDTDADGTADKQTELVRLECSENKSHSGLVGLSIGDDDTLYLGLGKNTGKPYRVVGSDGTVFTGEGDGGTIFRCRTDGSQLERIATGLWNPWGMCVDPFGRLFCTENDPDSSPPCKLLHVVPGGDYGFEMRFGRDGRHPLQSPNGELPGTLGMVCALDEAACGIQPYRGSLWVASWGEHTIRQYRLVPQGASFQATSEIVVQGESDFRPVGLAEAPDGSLYLSDWVNRSYPLHGQGRIWKLSLNSSSEKELQYPEESKAEKTAQRLRAAPELSALSSPDTYLRQAAIFGFANQQESSIDWQKLEDGQQRLGILEAMRWRGLVPSVESFRAMLNDPRPEVKVFATRWIAELQLRELQGDIRKLLDDRDIDVEQFLIYLSAADWLEQGAVPQRGRFREEVLVEELLSHNRSAPIQANLLRMLPPDHESLSPSLLREFMKSDNAELRQEAVRTISLQGHPERFVLLAEIAATESYDEAMRLEAINGLSAAGEKHEQLLSSLSESDLLSIPREAARSLRLGNVETLPQEAKPTAADIDAWLALLEEPGDADAGARLFFSPAGPPCGRCHRFDGRGSDIGPDLTHIGQHQSRRRILTSILQPSEEVGDQYTHWTLLTDAGKIYSGLPVAGRGVNGMEEFINPEGKLFVLSSDTIEKRERTTESLMPAGLEKVLTIDDMRDLVAFLMSTGLGELPGEGPQR